MPTLSTAVAVAVLAGAAEAGTLGPGAGAWQLADPSTVGLDAAALKQAAAEVALVAPVRYCTGVIADGKLILEVNHANSSSTQCTRIVPLWCSYSTPPKLLLTHTGRAQTNRTRSGKR